MASDLESPGSGALSPTERRRCVVGCLGEEEELHIGGIGRLQAVVELREVPICTRTGTKQANLFPGRGRQTSTLTRYHARRTCARMKVFWSPLVEVRRSSVVVLGGNVSGPLRYLRAQSQLCTVLRVDLQIYEGLKRKTPDGRRNPFLLYY
jgi:hypothetical protein